MSGKAKGEKIVPEVPQLLVDRICENRAVLWVGAGLSRIAGLPTWSELLEKL